MVAAAVPVALGVASTVLGVIGLTSGKKSAKQSNALAQQAAANQLAQTQAFNNQVLAMQGAAAEAAAGFAAAQAAQTAAFNNQIIGFQEQSLAAQKAAQEEARKRAEIANVRQRQQLAREGRVAQGDLQQAATTANASASSAFAGASASIAQQEVSGVSFLNRSQQTVNDQLSHSQDAAAFGHKIEITKVKAGQAAMDSGIAAQNDMAQRQAAMGLAEAQFGIQSQFNQNQLNARLGTLQNRAAFHQGLLGFASNTLSQFGGTGAFANLFNYSPAGFGGGSVGHGAPFLGGNPFFVPNSVAALTVSP